ncbi:ERMES complex subunit MDM34 [Sporobolomyces koalae]|uniref:ERMES complex subunit MDM34 n=1 Tax=Sporobolomyces koalae TaxID=500713 RepID=UPI00317159BD
MSFNFEWPEFSEAFYQDAREMLAQALNKGQKPPIIADRIEVKELNMGTIPPELEILEIGDLSTERFRGIFRLTYSGDAYIVLQTKVQANPLNVPRPSLDILGAPRILFAAAPLVVPMTLRLSSLSLRAIVVLVVSRQKGITLVFKNDPLESVDVSSSFDGVESVAGFIQREIEAQLREAFRSDLPSVIHRLSQKWLSGEVKSAGEGAANLASKARVGLAGGFEKDAKIETRTAYVGGGGDAGISSQGIGNDPSGTRRGGAGRGLTRRMSAAPSDMGESVELESQYDSTWSTSGAARRGTSSGRSFGRSPSVRSTDEPLLRHDQLDSVPESIEAYDPTYGLRPDSIPHHAGFADYRRLVRAGSSKRGLGDVLETAEEDGQEADEYSMQNRPLRTGDGSFDFDMIGLRDLVDDDHHPSVPGWPEGSRRTNAQDDRAASFETIPAVGGGVITRPRVFHTQSQIRLRTSSTGSASAHGSPSSVTARSAAGGSAASTVGLGRAAGFARSASLSRLPLQSDHPQDFEPTPSIASTPRFPFPRYPQAPPPAYSAASGSLPRNQSMPSLARFPSSTSNTIHRSNLSWQLSASSTSNEAAASRFPPHYSSANSKQQLDTKTPLASPTRALKPPPLNGQDPEEPLSFTRPSPIDLLSRSPSSVLNTSFLDEEHLPIVLNPGVNDSCAHLKTLSSTNQTLSPFTRENELVMARSSPRPVTPANGSTLSSTVPLTHSNGRVVLDRPLVPASPHPVKATRKRLHRIGSARPQGGSNTSSPRSTPASSVYSPQTGMSRRNSYQPMSATAVGTTIPTSHRKMPSLNVGGGGGGGGIGLRVGVGGVGGTGNNASRAPSELSDYFPSAGSGSVSRAAQGGAREMLSRLNL